ncbi:unnamed protein product [Clonostachys byssicola]|uniref:C2H2-type domain-containing protein n=1 Tax=Clonostachys byssicola TaxID=160290 RepID=A0A9N9U9Z5_9HYPO|nr:unnamed protein product [Clonostachys byssicola]
MRFSAVILTAGAMSAISGVSAQSSNGVGELRARSAKDLLHLAIRSLDDEQADAVFARYLELNERNEESSSIFKRDIKCPYCSIKVPKEYAPMLAAHIKQHTK